MLAAVAVGKTPPKATIIASLQKKGNGLVFQRAMEAKRGARDVTTNWRRKIKQIA